MGRTINSTNKCRFRIFYRDQEAVSATRQRFDEPWRFGVITQRLPQLDDCLVKAAIELNESVAVPQCRPDLLSSYQFRGAVQEQAEDAKRLLLKADAVPVLAQFT
jgi:hypothetical protein